MAVRFRWGLATTAALALVAILTLAPQWRSLEGMGARRAVVLARPPAEILVGVSWPFSIRRDGMAEGLRLAQDEINQGGLAGGIPVRLVLRDDQGVWAEARRIALDFADTPAMSAVIGYDDIRLALRAAPIFEKSRLLYLLPAVGNPDPGEASSRYAIRTAPSLSSFARALAVAAGRPGESLRFALIWDEDGPGKELATQFLIAQSGMGGNRVFQWPYLTGRADFRASAYRLREIEADLIVIAGPSPDLVDFLRKADGAGLIAPILVIAEPSDALWAQMGTAAWRRAIFPQIYDVAAMTSENRAFVDKFRARFGKDPDAAAAQGYDTLRLLAEAVRTTGSAEPLDLIFALRQSPAWAGAVGEYRFDRQGEVRDRIVRLVPGEVSVTSSRLAPAPASP
ncbi:ABC transporter substrate-binding protein [Magnetospirillum molischianum]|nr:ABC transporter substrate-binding protein [Magnetospirillum molischianum]